MTTAVQKHVSQSIQQSRSAVGRRWTGLCVACCLALNWPLSMENLGAVKVSLLSIYAQRLRAAFNGEPVAPSEAEWSTFAQKALADLKRDSARMLVGTRWGWLNFLQSSLTRRIYSSRRTLQRSRRPSSTGVR
jgi:hypothetical protein